MQVLRFIVRFLGISALIVWVLGTIASAEDDITVNFPEQMTVNGSVSITNLGLTGDPQYNYEEFPQPQTAGINDGGEEFFQVPETFISSFDSYDFLKLNPAGSTASTRSLFTIKVPVFDWATIKSSFASAFYGSKFGSNINSPTTNKFLPGFSGPQNLFYGSSTYGHTVVTDQFGSGNWSMDFDWRYLACNGPNGDYNFDVLQVTSAMNTVFAVLLWFEITFSIIGKLSNG